MNVLEMFDAHDFSESGNRIRFVRHLTGKTREYFCEKYDLSSSTLRFWECGSTISRKAATRVYDTFSAEGVLLDVNWIYTGQGNMPTLESVQSNLNESITYDEDISIIQDIFSFKERYKNSVDAIVLNSDLKPFCHIGDYVAGVPIKTNLDNLEDRLCIVVDFKGGKHVGILSKDNKGFFIKNAIYDVVYNIENEDLVYKVTLIRSKAQ